MTGDLQTWLFDTALWTAVLIGFVLLVRRPVAQIFGARAAYALWALPFLRLILPPLTLPAWLAPVQSPSEAASLTITYLDAAPIAGGQAAAATVSAIDWPLIALALWLGGAAIFLTIRFRFYFQMRRELLEHAHPVGDAGDVRLIETPETQSPIAFGVIDKVVALPEGFMALTNRTERDLALEHELSHHNARDLLANFMVQPLFALHWFNPLGWYGWRAMRRDQEAACDARVMAARGDTDKAAYASIIANFATGPNIALAAPMACPVIGEKSIIHRLRSLTMTDISPRRRIAGRVLMGAALVALPLTASVTYAESLTGTTPPPPPPAPPSAIAAPPAPPSPLMMQAAPEAPEAPEVGDAEKRVIVIREVNKDGDGEHSDHKVIHSERKVIIRGDEHMTEQERDAMIKEVEAELEAAKVEVDGAMEEVRVAMIEMETNGERTKVRMDCKGDKGQGHSTAADGTKIVHICKAEIMANALTGLKSARAAIASNKELAADMRAEALKAIDQQISNWDKEG